jgi:serine/threonine-protein kinase RsbW
MPVNPSRHAHLVLSSRFENIEIAERALVDLCGQAGFSGDDCYWLVTALREAAANAIRHGNRQDPEKSVLIDLRIHDGEVLIRVEDEGEGFDIDAIPDPTDPDYLLRPSGRGIFYMRQFMTGVTFSRSPGGGTVVEMTRRLEPETRSSGNEE